MTAALDDGLLTAKKCSYRNFTTFLDLKQEYGRELVRRLWTHACVIATWRDLAVEEAERRRCAQSFLHHYGLLYWGEQNRAQYLMSQSLADEASLCRYPERKKE